MKRKVECGNLSPSKRADIGKGKDEDVPELISQSPPLLDIFYSLHQEKQKASDELKKAITNRYENKPFVSKHSYFPKSFQPLFSSQSELGKPVKIDKEYKNAFFSNLATVNYFHTYISGIFTLGLIGGIGKQFKTEEKKKYKTYADTDGLYQLIDDQKRYIPNGFYRYIVSPKGGLYILTDDIHNAFHNSIRGSQPVQCAGEVMIRNGKIGMIGNQSGHYRPTRAQLVRTLGGLYAAGLILNDDANVKCFKIDGYLSYSIQDIGTIADLIHSGEIKIPSPWQATPDIHDMMAQNSVAFKI